MKKYICICLLLVLCTGLVACGQLEDTNGEQETGLATLTKEELVATFTGSSTIGTFHSKAGDTLSYKALKLSGVVVLDSIKVTDQTSKLTVSVQSQLERGNLCIYLRCDGKILGQFTPGQSDSLTLEQPTPGQYELCVAGESAKFELSATIQAE